MIGYALKRLLGALPTLFIIVTVAFFMMRAAPGGPFDSARKLPPEIERNIKAAYNLDKPLMLQYGIYLERLAQGDLGPSYKNKDFTVAQLIGPSGVIAGAAADAGGHVVVDATVPVSERFVRAEVRRPSSGVDPGADLASYPMVALTNPVFSAS